MPQAQCPRVVELNSPYPETFGGLVGTERGGGGDQGGCGWGGQSALENAALLNEADADVEVLVRDSRARWGECWRRSAMLSGAVRRLPGCSCFTARRALERVVAA